MNPLELRIGDQEREAAAAALGEHFALGRITREEYDERSTAVWAARTGTELRPVFADLPAPHPAALGATPRGPRRALPGPSARRRVRVPVLPLLLVVVGIALLTEWWVAPVLVGLAWWALVFVVLRRLVRRVGGACRAQGAALPPGSRAT